MSTAIHADPTPMRADADGVIRVGTTRVTLDTLYAAYCDGATAEEIHLRYESVPLADVHAVIAYCLRHRDEIDVYLSDRITEASAVRERVEARQGVQAIRERLMKRKAS